jgi:transcriptional regulator with XRE-family HTH domain
MVAIDVDEMRRRRQLQGLNQADLAREAKIHRSNISRLERGHQATVSPRMFARICDALKVKDREELMAS